MTGFILKWQYVPCIKYTHFFSACSFGTFQRMNQSACKTVNNVPHEKFSNLQKNRQKMAKLPRKPQSKRD